MKRITLVLLLACLMGSVVDATEPVMTPTDIDTCSNSSECPGEGRQQFRRQQFAFAFWLA